MLSSLQSNIKDGLLRCKVFLNVANALFHCEEYIISESICRQGKKLCEDAAQAFKEQNMQFLSLSIKFRYLRAANLIVDNSDVPFRTTDKLAERKIEKLRKAESLLNNGLLLLQEHFQNDIDERLKFMSMLKRASKQIVGSGDKSPLVRSPGSKPSKIYQRGSLKLSSSKGDLLSRQRDANLSEVSSHNMSHFSNSSNKIKIISKNGFNSDRGAKKHELANGKGKQLPSHFQRACQKSYKIPVKPTEDPTLSPKYHSEVLRPRDSFRISEKSDYSIRVNKGLLDNLDVALAAANNNILPETLNRLNEEISPIVIKLKTEIPDIGEVPIERNEPINVVSVGKIEKLESLMQNPQGAERNKTNTSYLLNQESLNVTILKPNLGNQDREPNQRTKTKRSKSGHLSSHKGYEQELLEDNHASLMGLSEDPSLNQKPTPVSSMVINQSQLSPKLVGRNLSTNAKGSLMLFSENNETTLKDQLSPSPIFTRRPSQVSTIPMATETYREAIKTPSRSARSSQFYFSTIHENKHISRLTARHYRTPKTLTYLNRTNTK